VRYANQLPDHMERLIVDLKRNKGRPVMCPIGLGDRADSRATSAPSA